MTIPFRTTFAITEAENKLDFGSRILLGGSCFTENIGARLAQGKFNVHTNPFGIIFNPVSLADMLERIVKAETFSADELIQVGNKWVSLYHHGAYSGKTPDETLGKINSALREASDFMQQCTHIVITLGTVWVYRHKSRDQIAANCHKMPQLEFSKEILTLAETEKALRRMLAVAANLSGKPQVIFTLSPIRHWRDGAVENQRSKSILHAAIQNIIETEPHCTYFPAYELVMDDLRDYRFYEADMIHPSKVAIDYIWERFKAAWINTACFLAMEEFERLYNLLNHRIIRTDRVEAEEFYRGVLSKLETLAKKYPETDFSVEQRTIQERLST